MFDDPEILEELMVEFPDLCEGIDDMPEEEWERY
jgi:hypothetical protein